MSPRDRDARQLFPDAAGIVPDPFADPVTDPLHDVSACEVALFERAHGGVQIERRDLLFGFHRALLGIIERSPSTAPRLEEYAEQVVLVPALARQFGTAEDFAQWWRWIGSHDPASLPADLPGYLRRLSLLREGRWAALCAARAFERQTPELAVEDLRRISTVLRTLRARGVRRAA